MYYSLTVFIPKIKKTINIINDNNNHFVLNHKWEINSNLWWEWVKTRDTGKNYIYKNKIKAWSSITTNKSRDAFSRQTQDEALYNTKIYSYCHQVTISQYTTLTNPVIFIVISIILCTLFVIRTKSLGLWLRDLWSVWWK